MNKRSHLPSLVRSRAPLRLGFGGGGTDVAPFPDLYGGYVLNGTIDLYAYCTIEFRNDNKICFSAVDLGQQHESDITDYIEPTGHLKLHQGIYNRIVKDYNNGEPLSITVTTYTDVPAGSGLGSSSTLVVAIIKSYMELLSLPLDDYDLANLAHEIERVDLECRGGKQDQYAATFGGINFIEFYGENRVIVNPLKIKNWIICELESSLVLYYTGVSRESSRIIQEQSDRIENNDDIALQATHDMKNEAMEMKEAILLGNLNNFAQCMNRGWEAKKKSADGISNTEINKIFELAKRSGAHAGKVSGAGGGGFMMFFVEPEKRMNVIQELSKHPGKILGCHFTKHGAQG